MINEEDIELNVSIQPRDILGPIATLLGLLVASVGFLHTSTISPAVLETSTVIILIVMAIFIFTAGSVSLYSYTGRLFYWRRSLYAYVFSWYAFGVGIGLIFLSIAFNINTVKLPLMGRIPVYLMFLLVLMVSGIIGETFRYRTVKIENLREIDDMIVIGKGQSYRSRKVENHIKKNIFGSVNNAKMIFLDRFVNIERQLKETIRGHTGRVFEIDAPFSKVLYEAHFSGLIDDSLYESLKALSRVRNRIAKGYALPKKVIYQWLEIAESALDRLKYRK